MRGAIPFPWDDVLAFLLGRLRWRPADVWSATLREVTAALPASHGAPMRAAELDNLMARYPDG